MRRNNGSREEEVHGYCTASSPKEHWQIQKNPEDQAEGTVDLRRASVTWILQSPGRVSGKEFWPDAEERGQDSHGSTLILEKMWGPEDSTQWSWRVKTEIEPTKLIPILWGHSHGEVNQVGSLTRRAFEGLFILCQITQWHKAVWLETDLTCTDHILLNSHACQ